MRPVVNIKSKCFDITDKSLGAGSFSLVKIAYKQGDKTPIALKICHCNTNSEWLQSLNEICLLKKLSHENIATITDYEITRFHVLIGLHPGEGTLKHLIATKLQAELHTFSLTIMSQLINALNYIHSYKIVHGDIKPSNVIYNFENKIMKIQVMDFGLSHVVGREDGPALECETGGTKNYLSPERLARMKYDETSDIFSAGIVYFELLFRKHPFHTEGDNYEEVMKSKPDPKFPIGYQSHIPKEWLILLCTMLSYNRKTRTDVRNNSLLETTFTPYNVDHQVVSLKNISDAEIDEENGKYTNAAIKYMQASINLGIAYHETDNPTLINEYNNKITQCRKKVLNLINSYKHSYAQFDQCGSSTSIHDEYYDYLMEVTASTPGIRHYLEIGYNGELYYRECNNEIALKSFMDALQYLNVAMQSEPPGDRKTIIGKKMLQWTAIAEALQPDS